MVLILRKQNSGWEKWLARNHPELMFSCTLIFCPYPKWHLREWFYYKHACLQLIKLGVSKQAASDCIYRSLHQTHGLYQCIPTPHNSPFHPMSRPKTESVVFTGALVTHKATPRSVWNLSISTRAGPQIIRCRRKPHCWKLLQDPKQKLWNWILV